jgi:hypothetical protein
MVFSITGDVVRDFDEEHEAWAWLESQGWGLVAIEPPDPVRPGAYKYYFKRQRPGRVSNPETQPALRSQRTPPGRR